MCLQAESWTCGFLWGVLCIPAKISTQMGRCQPDSIQLLRLARKSLSVRWTPAPVTLNLHEGEIVHLKIWIIFRHKQCTGSIFFPLCSADTLDWVTVSLLWCEVTTTQGRHFSLLSRNWMCPRRAWHDDGHAGPLLTAFQHSDRTGCCSLCFQTVEIRLWQFRRFLLLVK